MEEKKAYKEIFELDVSNQGLKTLPKDIGEYSNLKVLDISGNELEELPEVLKSFKHLEKLNISYNYFIDIPFWLWKLDGLKELNISGLNLGDLPVEVGGLKKLEVLTANESNINSLPESIGYLKNLKELGLKKNALQKLPRTFSYLEKIEKLNLRENKFQVFPKSIFNFTNIEYVNVSANSIKVIPKQINTLTKLTYLNISDNKLKTVPDTVYKLKLKKTHFHFKGNSFSRATSSKLASMFGEKPKKTIVKKKVVKTSYKKPEVKKRVVLSEDKNRKGKSLVEILLPIILIAAIPFSFILVECNEERAKEAKVEADFEAYKLAVKNEKECLERMLAKTAEVFVYTNDPSELKLTIHPNADFHKKNFSWRSSDYKQEFINDFLETKSYGYSVNFITKREELKNILRVYDSVIPKDTPKKFRVTRYYRMNSLEKEYNEKREKKNLMYYGKRMRKDTVFGISSGVVNFEELKNKKVKNNLSALFMPRFIDATRIDNYIYFTPLNANVTRKEFEEAIEYFKPMFIRKGNADEKFVIKTIKVTKDPVIKYPNFE